MPAIADGFVEGEARQVIDLPHLFLLAVDQQQIFHWEISFCPAMTIHGTPNRSVTMPKASAK
jgi:hypothetical protein